MKVTQGKDEVRLFGSVSIKYLEFLIVKISLLKSI